jgi:hypothetical protein
VCKNSPPHTYSEQCVGGMYKYAREENDFHNTDLPSV